MNVNDRRNEILENFESFKRKTYRRNEALSELLSLQKEMVDIAFKESVPEKDGFRIDQVVESLREKNEYYGHCADATVSAFEADAKNLSNAIGALISGNKGEAKTFAELDKLCCNHIILKNVELIRENERTEIDAIVLTSQAVFLIEVKNTRNNICIQDDGAYYICGRYLRRDKNIKERIALKRALLMAAFKEAGVPAVPIESFLVFTNDYIQVENQCPDVHHTFLGLLCDEIQNYGTEERISESMALKIEKAIDGARSNESYPVKVDVPKIKEDFAEAVAILEKAEEMKLHPDNSEQVPQEKNEIDSDSVRNCIAVENQETHTEKINMWKDTLHLGIAGVGMAAITAIFAIAGYEKAKRP